MNIGKISLPQALLTRKIQIIVIGCGGTGSQVVSLLARLHLALLANGHPFGLNVKVYDPDRVSEANVGRQLFYSGDVGKPKAEVLVRRINFAFSLQWQFETAEYHGGRTVSADFLIGCVDSIRSRKKIYTREGATFLIDCGNGSHYGQVLLDAPGGASLRELAPELFRSGEEPPDDGPSCSLAEALTKQELLVNDFAARIAVQMIWNLLRHGEINFNAVFYNLNTMTMRKCFQPKERK